MQAPNPEKKNSLPQSGLTVFLLTVLLMIVGIHLALHKNIHFIDHRTTAVEWVQPVNAKLHKDFVVPVGNNVWDVNFTSIETILWNAKVNSEGQLLINWETAALLEQVCKNIPHELTSREFQRIRFLVERGHSEAVGRQLSDLMGKYCAFQKEYESSLSNIREASGDTLFLLLKKSEQHNTQRQAHYFGAEAAKALFSKKNLNTSYITQRRIVNLDKNLTEAQKTQRLSKLQETYRRALSAWQSQQ